MMILILVGFERNILFAFKKSVEYGAKACFIGSRLRVLFCYKDRPSRFSLPRGGKKCLFSKVENGNGTACLRPNWGFGAAQNKFLF